MSPLEAVRLLREAGITHIELSGGTPVPGLVDGLRELAGDVAFQLHNYFPPPLDPFVFNLCDPDPVGRERSIAFACQAIDLGLEFGSTNYAFHAGFLGTPGVKELGRTWNVTNRLSVDEGTAIFVKSVERVSSFARDRGVRLLVENNVLNRGTADSSGEDILLMTTPEGIRTVMDLLPDDVRLMLDVAHLGVSARTLGFDALKAMQDVTDLVGGYHVSDNDGLADSNDPVTENSWFWGAMSSQVAFVTVEVNPGQVEIYAQQAALVEQKLAMTHAG